MKKVMILILAVTLLIAFFQASFAQMYAANGDAPVFKEEGEKEISPEKFNEIKSFILAKIEERTKRLSDEKACVEAAKDSAELKKCRPERPEGPGGQGGPGQQKSQKPTAGRPR